MAVSVSGGRPSISSGRRPTTTVLPRMASISRTPQTMGRRGRPSRPTKPTTARTTGRSRRSTVRPFSCGYRQRIRAATRVRT
ncbi:hypothetical protein HLASF_1144 [Halanaeroarchaeum sulfurireducens]|uniref:Uncharacterized protein n=1 Tax=Halanaeroarchaeum sulfurireducens TaxID=1604004 RepID=A0A0F7PA32_9EURY|nr:hypothetical protein HLASF_1144 [Halanaeroarchaeum sulfurireducens]ALG82028.1 hypothetical protein HLASA_1133 [Halanaeroarchaeum sulfurireducens]